MENEAIFTANYRVRVTDADRNGILKLRALFQMLQEIADAHARKLKVSAPDLKEKNLAWALSKMAVEVDRLPKWDERVFLKTWASGRERIVTYREFDAVSESGNPLFRASSQWLLFDSKTRRIAKLERLETDWPRDNSKAVECDFSSHLQNLPPTMPPVVCTVRNDDIDLNAHVNNSVYIVWAIEPLPQEFLDEHRPKKITINFLEETFPKNRIESNCAMEGAFTTHSLLNKESGHECARINIQWAKI